MQYETDYINHWYVTPEKILEKSGSGLKLSKGQMCNNSSDFHHEISKNINVQNKFIVLFYLIIFQ